MKESTGLFFLKYKEVGIDNIKKKKYCLFAFSLDLRIAGSTRLPSYRKENKEFTTTLGA